ncbi:MAG: hypothetical protein DRJ42_20775 [Deltaproteobacteria bacterium]|nr:MAG: hypothetical protein DRJ42_20775 [Deltaproteobacteria bacterium]
MTTPAPPTIIPPPSVTSETPETRIARLRAELEATTDPEQQASLHQEIGVIAEFEVGNPGGAVKEYLAAFNLAPTFRPPLFSLTRIFERKRSFNNLGRLHEAEATNAPNDADRASALLDQAAIAAGQSGDFADALAKVSEAYELDPTSGDVCLMLELEARRATDPDLMLKALEARAVESHDPVLQSLLLTELARDQAEQGAIDDAFETIRRAVALPNGRYRALVQMERLARAHDRTEDLIPALEGQALLADAAAKGQDRGQGSGAFSVRRFATEAKAGAAAAALLYEAARIRLSAHGDAAGAAHSLAQALAMSPDDVLLHQTHMLACELAGDLESAAAEAQRLLEEGAEGSFGASLHFRLAEIAQATGDESGAKVALASALAADPGSAAVAAMLDDLLIDLEDHEGRALALEGRGAAEAVSTEGRARALLRAAEISATDLVDFDRARKSYDQAVSLAEDKVTLLRELYGAAVRSGSWDAARDALRVLRVLPVDEEERSALWYDLHHVVRHELGDAEGADALLSEAMEVEACASWAPYLLRLHAARSRDWPLLAEAHVALADRTTDDEAAGAHLAAAGRAVLRVGDEARAMELLRRALERSPGHRYAVPLLEELLIANGEAEAAVALLREAAEAQAGARAAELNLLMAGAAAEASGDAKLAAETYEQATDQDPTSLAPLLALRRLAIQEGDVDLLLRSREGLSERELSGGQAGWATLELAEHYDLVANKPELAEARYRAALGAPTVAASAAAALSLSPAKEVAASARIEAYRTLLDAAPEGPARVGLLRAITAEGSHKRSDMAAAAEAAKALSERDPSDVMAAWARITGGAIGSERADAWVNLATAADDPETRAELTLLGLRAKLVAQGDDAVDDAFLLAQEIGAATPEMAASGIALDETLAAGDDPEARAEALGARLLHAGKGGGPLQAAVGRALVAAGRPDEAYRNLRAVLDEDPKDLSSWEALRLAARDAEQWADVVTACDTLAEVCDGELEAQLLEESAAILMDEMEGDAEAELRLLRAVEIDVTRPIAFGRLHDLLAERSDTEGLAELVAKRIGALDDPEELVKLFYEQARLHRSQGAREEALGSLENLLMLEPDHVGGLALSVEIRVSLAQWSEAVEALQVLSGADVPLTQKRLSILGAANFLEKKLDDPSGALVELEKLVELGLGDASLFERMAGIAERADDFPSAVAALGRAAEVTEGPDRAAVERRAAAMLHDELSDDAGAMSAYRRALEATPTDLEAAEGLIELVVDPVDRETASRSFETAVRVELDDDPTEAEALRKLIAAARWRGDSDLEYRTLDVLHGIGAANADETAARTRLVQSAKKTPTSTLTPEVRALLRPPVEEPIAELAKLVWEAIADLDHLDPGSFGVGRSNLINAKTESPLRRAISAWAGALGGGLHDLYVGGEDGRVVAVMPGKKGPTWVVGKKVNAPLDHQVRFLVAQLGFAYAEGTLPFVLRSADDAATILYAAAAAGEAPLLAGSARAGLAELTKALGKKMARKTRKAVPAIAQTIRDTGVGVPAFCEATQRAALRAGLVGAGELRVPLEALLGNEIDAAAARDHAEARALVTFWLSEQARTVRSALGVAR